MPLDLWLALRRIRLRPFHSGVVALTLGLGIGASVAVFSVVDAVLVRPLPYPAPDRLVRITQSMPIPGLPEQPLSDVAFSRMVQEGRSLAGTAAYTTRDANVLRPDAAQRLIVAQVSASLFEVLQLAPALGRGFTAEEDLPHGPRALVLADWLWQSAFESDPAVIGSVVTLEGEPHTVVGVLRPEVSFPSRQVGAWEPLRLDPAAVNPYRNNFNVVGRLRDGIALDQAARDLTEPLRAVGREFPGPHAGSVLDQAGYRAQVRPLADSVVGDIRPVVVLLLGGVLVLLLLTCANVVNLQLAAVVHRREELAVRAALGATRSRLMQDAVLEGIVLAALGAILGGVLAGFGARLMTSLLPPGIAVTGPLIGGRVILVAAAIVLAVGTLVGAIPVATVARRDPAIGLREQTGGSSPWSAHRVRRVLAVTQVALAIVLLHGSGLLISSAREVQALELGFRPDSTATLRINLPAAVLRDRGARESLLRRLVDAAGALPGVTAVGLVNALPLTPGRRDLAMAVEGRPFKADGTDPLADYRVTTEGYFAAMGIPLHRGRLFTDDEASAIHTPLVISEGLARELFPDGEDPLGQRLRFGPAAPWMPIVGVVADARNRSLVEAPRPELYAPGLGTWATLAFQSEITLVVRARGEAMTLAPSLSRIVRDLAPEVATYALTSMQGVVRDASARMTTVTRLMSGYAGVALLLAMAGTYAVLAYLVTQRRRELAIRMALGAAPRQLIALVVRESATLVGIGLMLGLVGSAVAGRLLTGLLYGVGPFDPRAILLVLSAAGVSGVVAAFAPARRATLVDPAQVLRGGG